MDGNKKKMIRNSFFILFAIVMLLFVSYAMFSYAKPGSEENKVSTGTLILTLDDSSSNGIDLAGTVPVADEEGLASTPYIFTIKNSGVLNSSYELSLVDDDEKYASHGCENIKLPWSKIKYSITKNGGDVTTSILDETAFDTDTLMPEETNQYTLRLWIDSSAGNEIMGTHFHGKIQVKAIQEGHTNYDTGA